MVTKASSWASSPAVRRNMQANRSRDTRPELAIRSALFARGLRYRVNFAPLPGTRRTADVVFTRARVAVFIDGCFWHGCPEHHTFAKTNPEFWSKKVLENRGRDADTDARLAAAQWVSVRIWEHEPVEGGVERILEALASR
jgi:DNA mismatch endonuclease (patch repair protein)